MADNSTGLNAQYENPGALYGGATGYTSTGAAGSAGDTAQQSQGPVIASPVVSTPFASSQIPANMPRVNVLSGDTSAMSSDQAIGDNFKALSGQGQDALTSTGAGMGTDITSGHHPNAAGR